MLRHARSLALGTTERSHEVGQLPECVVMQRVHCQRTGYSSRGTSCYLVEGQHRVVSELNINPIAWVFESCHIET